MTFDQVCAILKFHDKTVHIIGFSEDLAGNPIYYREKLRMLIPNADNFNFCPITAACYFTMQKVFSSDDFGFAAKTLGIDIYTDEGFATVNMLIGLADDVFDSAGRRMRDKYPAEWGRLKTACGYKTEGGQHGQLN